MKKLFVIPIIALLFVSCGSPGANTDAVEAAVATLTEEELEASCETIEFYTADGFLRELSKAYDNGKQPGIIWIRVNHDPNKPDLAYMVELIDDKCNNE